MSYLIPSDYNRSIQDPTLQQIISGNTALVGLAELSAISEMISYLSQKYDTSREFTPTLVYSQESTTYQAECRVYLNAASYDTSKPYAVGSLVLYSGIIYVCKTEITVGEAFTVAKWDALGFQYQMLYALLPAPEFSITGYYSPSDVVFYKNHTYKALQQTRVYSHQDLIQMDSTNNVPYQNVIPDDKLQGSDYWFDQGAYAIAAGKIQDETIFTQGDNRNQQLVEYLMDMVIFKLYKRISPKDIPQGRVDAYSVALGWLKQAAKGTDITADIPKVQPPSGNRIRFGSKVKRINTY